MALNLGVPCGITERQMPTAVAAPLLSAIHVLALGIGLGAVFMRGRYFRALRTAAEPRILKALFVSDTLWGVAALLWVATGLTRAFAHVEKAPEFYLRNGFFWLKMVLVASVLLLEVWPMTRLIRWRIAQRKRQPLPQLERLSGLIVVGDIETALVVVIPFVAAAMARGFWLY
jgi:putative membrane protein